MNAAVRILSGGVLAGALAWMALGRAEPPLDLPQKAARPAPPPMVNIADAIAMPIFSVAPDSVTDPGQAPAPSINANGSVRLIGVMLTPRKRAALISISGGPATWISEGQTANGLTVSRLTRSGAEITDGNGAHRLQVFRTDAPTIVQPAAQPSANVPAPPTGLPPASAPPTAVAPAPK